MGVMLHEALTFGKLQPRSNREKKNRGTGAGVGARPFRD
jgi:hypothetical protein